MTCQTKESTQTLSYRIALGGIIAAICIVCMFLTGVIPMFYLILPMLASAFIYIMALETNDYWGLLTYLAVGLLSILVTPSKSAALVFLLFFGYYPLIRHKMNRFRWKPVGFLCRWAIFNAAVMIYFWGSVYLLGQKAMLESLGDYGKYGGWIMLGMANLTFLCYDYSMGMFPQLYRHYLKSRISPSTKKDEEEEDEA